MKTLEMDAQNQIVICGASVAEARVAVDSLTLQERAELLRMLKEKTIKNLTDKINSYNSFDSVIVF